ncbi:MAG: cytochrome oxidase Cu insertion factor (SCO1/SenC/PrrC family) [Verrucomicrobiales bacterium]|jgi:cytochrome oxidase Cu insertion factor (SCO1/SenC/PrrC family)
MKKFITAIISLALAGSAFAGCGKKVTNTGEYKYDAEKKMLTGEGLAKPIAILATTVVKDADGKKTTIDKLEGKITVISEHNKADSVAPAKAKKG